MRTQTWFGCLYVGALIVTSYAVPARAQHRDSIATVELWHVETGLAMPSIDGTRFQAFGTPMGSMTPGRVYLTARDLGLSHPIFLTLGIHPVVHIGRHFWLGPFVDFSTGGSPDQPLSPAADALGAGQSVSMTRYGGEAGTAFDLGPLEVRGSAQAGNREFNTALMGLQPTPCKAGVCYPTASGSQPFVAARLAVDAVAAGLFVFGGYVGVDLYPAIGFSAGVMLAVRFGVSTMTQSHSRHSSAPVATTTSTTTVTTTTVTTTVPTAECVPVQNAEPSRGMSPGPLEYLPQSVAPQMMQPDDGDQPVNQMYAP